MKLIGLKFRGIGPYRGEFSVDFAALTRSHLFLIDGETGAGKTTILDCITYALYGNISGDARSGTKQRLRSRFLDGAQERSYADLIFEEGGNYYKVYRSPEYMCEKTRGEGRTAKSATANMMRVADDHREEFRALTQADPGDFEANRSAERYYGFFDEPGHAEPITAKAKEVSLEVIALLGLNRDQFSKTVMLAQGQFAEFLRMKPEDRTGLVKDLFAAQEYEQIQEQLRAMRQQYGNEVDDRRRELIEAIHAGQSNAKRIHEAVAPAGDDANADPSADSSAEPNIDAHSADAAWGLNADGDIDEPAHSVDEIATMLDTAMQAVGHDAATLLDETKARYDAADQAWHEAQQRYAAAGALAKAVEDRGKAGRRIELLESVAQQIEADERRAQRSAQAAPIVELMRDLADQNRLIEENTDQLVQREAVLGEYETPEELSLRYEQAMKAAAGAQTIERELELAQNHADLLARAKRAQAAAAQAEKTLRDCEAKTAEAGRRLAQFPDTQAIMERLGAIDAALGAKDRLDDDVKRAETVLTHAKCVERLGDELVKAKAQVAATSRAHADAVAAHREAESLLRAAGAAGYAQDLKEGDPCPVCGSGHHPHPAKVPEGVPARSEVDALQALEEQRRNDVDKARVALVQTETDIKAETEACGKLTVAEAERNVDQARQAKAKLGTLEQERRELDLQRGKRELAERAAKESERSFAMAKAMFQAAGQEAERAIADAEGISDESVNRERENAQHRLDEAKRQQRYADQLKARIDERTAIATRITELKASGEALARQRDAIERKLGEKLETSAFADREEARAAWLGDEETERLRKRVEDYRNQYAAAHSELKRADDELASCRKAWNEVGDGQDPDRAAEAVETAGELRDEAASEQTMATALDTERQRLTAALHGKLKAWEQGMATYAPIRTMATLAVGDRESPAANKVSLITYVVTERFRDVLDRANELLKDIHGGVYELRLGEHEGRAGAKTGLPIEVFDRRTDLATEPATLSGGETFFVSLALALALADVIQAENGGVSMETLFIDEGFGTLSDTFLDDVMDVLGDIAHHRDVGIISHVGQLKGRIRERITVSRIDEDSESSLTVRL
ncbi:AAA family ATPase [Bifidobacterium sp. 64T4]|uniref:AAA family ATPase n=1 Tax=Bifidobacterium pongonis TaxID=2834432 RepID=UPI001C58E1F4|nr:AAA family ATPase [Bifidobacterium pongonis]MBW3094227.1 AAA family ATPase [Bifidobacterium pongonis]